MKVFVVTLNNSSGDDFGPVATYRESPSMKELEKLVWEHECHNSLEDQLDIEGVEGSGAFGSYTFYKITELSLL